MRAVTRVVLLAACSALSLPAASQEGKEDSAVVLFHVAARLEPTNPKPFSALAGLYATKDNDDSALVYYRQAAAAAGSDTTFVRDRKDALSNAWRLLVRRVQGHPAAQEIPQLRARRDSLSRAIPGDSTVLAKLVASSQSRKARRTTLAPADQRLFARDSTARAQAVERSRPTARRWRTRSRPRSPRCATISPPIPSP